MKRIWLWLLTLGIMLASAQAAAISVELFLNSIVEVIPNERSNDEVYLNVTANYSDGQYDSYTVPGHAKDAVRHYGARFPAGAPRAPMLYWHAKGLPQVKDISLWKGDLKAAQSVQLTVSLVEHDMPPWNLDDLIGTVKINIGIDKGKLSADWSLLSVVAKRSEGKFVKNASQELDLHSSEGLYKIKLTLK